MARIVRGANAQAAQSQEPEVNLTGPANSGKTFGILVKIHRYCQENPKVRVLMARKTREMMNETTLETWESEVYPKKLLLRRRLERRTRKSYSYPNGSRVILEGLENIEKIKGARFDLVYINEVTDLTEKEYQICASRLLHKKGPYRQIISDCNPAEIGEEHWLWKRHMRGAVKMYFSDHSLNPTFSKEDYERLSNMVGEERRRFFEGSWKAMPKGEIFKPEWFQYIDEFPVCKTWLRYYDIASGDSDEADYTVGVLMGRMADGRHVIGDVVRYRKAPNDRNNAMLLTAKSDARISALQFFERAHGIGVDMVTSVTNAFEAEGIGIQPIKPKGNKRFRADPLAQKLQAGRLLIVRRGLVDDLFEEHDPDLSKRTEHAWIQPFIRELCNFTGDEVKDKGKKDDQVDGASGANILLSRGAM